MDDDTTFALLDVPETEVVEQNEVEAEEVVVTAQDLIFIRLMVKAVNRGEFGYGDDVFDNLKAFGFTSEQAKALWAEASEY
jgi:hypothetical protein